MWRIALWKKVVISALHQRGREHVERERAKERECKRE